MNASPSRWRRVRVLTAATALSMMLSVAPGAPGSARADEHDTTESTVVPGQPDPEPPEPPPPAVWRAQRQNWADNWGHEPGTGAQVSLEGSAQDFIDVEFPTSTLGYVLVKGGGGNPSVMRSRVPTDDTGEPIEGARVWDVVHTVETFGAFGFGPDGTLGIATEGDFSGGFLHQTTNAGVEWGQPVHSSEKQFLDVAYSTGDGRGAVAVGNSPSTGASSRISRSVDEGETWTNVEDQNIPTSESLRAVGFAKDDSHVDEAVGVAVGLKGTIIETASGGREWTAASFPTEVTKPSAHFRDVALARDGESVAGVAVGDAGAIWWNDDVGSDEGQWRPAEVPAVAANTGLSGVDLVDADPSAPGGLVGYAVGTNLTVLEMAGGNPGQWTVGVVDPRSFRDASVSQFLPVLYRPTLDAVAVIEPGTGTVLAVGEDGVMLERTPLDPEDPEAFAEQLNSDRWWRCLPQGATGAPELDATLDETAGTLEAVEACHRRRKSNQGIVGSAEGNFGPTPALPCQLDEEQRAQLDARLPCVGTWTPITGFNRAGSAIPAPVPATTFLDEDMAGEGRRIVAVQGKRATTTGGVFLFDPDAPTGMHNADRTPVRGVQRGVDGFGGFRQCAPPRDLTRCSEVQQDATFGGASQFGFDTGVIDFKFARGDFPHSVGDLGAEAHLVAYDERSHRLFLASQTDSAQTKQGTAPVIAVVSLTGEFAPDHTEIPVVDPEEPGRLHQTVRQIRFDPAYGVLYVLTESNHRRDQVGLSLSGTDSSHVSLLAYRVRADSSTLERLWSLPLERHGCRTAEGLEFMGVTPEGDRIAFACQGHAGYHFGTPQLEPHKLVTVRLALRGQRGPWDLDPGNPSDIAVEIEGIGGKAMGESSVALGVEARSVLAWNQQAQGASLWDYRVGGWIGIVPYKDIASMVGFGLEADHPWRGRMYVRCSSCVDFPEPGGSEAQIAKNEPALLVVDSLNVPIQDPAQVSENLRVMGDVGAVRTAIAPRAAREQPRILTGGGHILMDDVSPALEGARPNPDAFTEQDVPEADASSVKRIGRASGYGARVWWTGAGSATAAGCQFAIGDHQRLADPCGSPTLSYEWLTDGDRKAAAGFVAHGRYTSAVPGLPGGQGRELRVGAVQNAALEANSSGQLSQAEAVGLFYDGGPADEARGNTGEDVGRRRGRDPDRFVDEQVEQFCDNVFFGELSSGRNPCEGSPDDPETEEDESASGWRDFKEQAYGPFDAGLEDFWVRFDELVDRGMREWDGERKIRGGCDDPDTDDETEDCFPEFDEEDRRSDAQRRGVEEQAGLTWASECLEPGERSPPFPGSRVECELSDGQHTEASAGLGAFSLAPKDGSAAFEGLSVGASGSKTRIVRDPAQDGEGVVVETTAFASEVELSVADRGSLSIGEVRTTARARARGREGTAVSSLDVAFEDVTITGENGARFACGRSDPDSGLPPVDPENPPQRDDPETEENESDFDRNRDGAEDHRDAVHAAGQAPDGRFAGPGENVSPAACDPHTVAAVISQVFAGKVQATTSDPDTDEKVTGSPGGAQAMVRRNPTDVLSDSVINRIHGQWELPGLQLTIFNDGLRSNRMQVDLAAVYAETHYEVGQRKTEFPAGPGSVEVSLSDAAGAPLSGGEFTLLADNDGDGTHSAADTPVRECTTGGLGSCEFDGLEAGAYVVAQRAAPPGFLAEDTARRVFVSEGSREQVSFVNVPDSGGVHVTLVDPSGNPLAGGRFALVPDPDGDGAVAPSDAVAASCVTGDDGACVFDRVGLGSWVLHQAAAPGGYQTADDIAFGPLNPGQVAQIRVVNGAEVAGATVTIIEIIDGAQPTSSSPDNPWWAMLPKGLAALLQRGWVQALLFALTGMLFGAPAYLAHRRRELALAKHRR